MSELRYQSLFLFFIEGVMENGVGDDKRVSERVRLIPVVSKAVGSGLKC
jgi:hypothetical protein